MTGARKITSEIFEIFYAGYTEQVAILMDQENPPKDIA